MKKSKLKIEKLILRLSFMGSILFTFRGNHGVDHTFALALNGLSV